MATQPTEHELKLNIENALNKISQGHCPNFFKEFVGENNVWKSNTDQLNNIFRQLLQFIHDEIFFNNNKSQFFNVNKFEMNQLNKKNAILKQQEKIKKDHDIIMDEFENKTNQLIEDINNIKNTKEKEFQELKKEINSNQMKEEIISQILKKIKKDIKQNEKKLQTLFTSNILPKLISKCMHYQTYYPVLYNKYNIMVEIISQCLYYGISNINYNNLDASYWGFINFLNEYKFISINKNYVIKNYNTFCFDIDLIFNNKNNNIFLKFEWSHFQSFQNPNVYDYLKSERVLYIITHFISENKEKYKNIAIHGVNINKKKLRIQKFGYKWKLYDLSKMKKENPNNFNDCITRLHGLIFCTKTIKAMDGYSLKTYPTKKDKGINNLDDGKNMNDDDDNFSMIDIISPSQSINRISTIYTNNDDNLTVNSNYSIEKSNRSRSRSRSRGKRQ